jgi:hypothetical protein
MKKIFVVLASAVSFVACRDNQYKAAQMNSEGTYTADQVGSTIGSYGQNSSTVMYKTIPIEQTRTVVVQQPRVIRQTRYVSTSSQPAKVKRGWSSAAKGAVIGAGSGAVLGAVISKNHRGKGAIIGGLLGAGGGYIIGRHKDKKRGRY